MKIIVISLIDEEYKEFLIEEFNCERDMIKHYTLDHDTTLERVDYSYNQAEGKLELINILKKILT